MILYVNSFAEAEKYPVLFGTAELFLDSDADKFYIKSVDQQGKATMLSFKFEQIENEKPLSNADFITRDDFNALTSKLDQLASALLAATAANTAVEEKVKPPKASKDKEDK